MISGFYKYGSVCRKLSHDGKLLRFTLVVFEEKAINIFEFALDSV